MTLQRTDNACMYIHIILFILCMYVCLLDMFVVTDNAFPSTTILWMPYRRESIKRTYTYVYIIIRLKEEMEKRIDTATHPRRRKTTLKHILFVIPHHESRHENHTFLF